MKILFIVLNISLIVSKVIVYFDFKRFIKAHEDELVENTEKGIVKRTILMIIISLAIGILYVLSTFI